MTTLIIIILAVAVIAFFVVRRVIAHKPAMEPKPATTPKPKPISTPRTEFNFYGFGTTKKNAWKDAESVGFTKSRSIYLDPDGQYYDGSVVGSGGTVGTGYYLTALGSGCEDSLYIFRP